MKTTFNIITLLLTLTFFSCKKEGTENATVIKDCTGTYLRMQGKDYKVCNIEKTSSLRNDINISVTFKKLTECDGSGNLGQICDLYHKFDSWIEIETIK